MIDVYAFATPNSVKVPIALEELGLDYALHPVNVRKGEQKADAFVALNANGKVPVLVDDGFVLTESAAILVHLAETTGRLIPSDPQGRARTPRGAPGARAGHGAVDPFGEGRRRDLDPGAGVPAVALGLRQPRCRDDTRVHAVLPLDRREVELRRRSSPAGRW